MIEVCINKHGFSFCLDWKQLNLKKDIVRQVKKMLNIENLQFSEIKEVNGDETEFSFSTQNVEFKEKEVIYPFN